MARRPKTVKATPLLEQIRAGLRCGEIPLDLAIALDAPGVLERAWVEQPFAEIPFTEYPGGLRTASVATKTTDFDGPEVYVAVLMYTRPNALFETLAHLRSPIASPSDDLTAALVLLESGMVEGAIHWATTVTRSIVSADCGLHGHPSIGNTDARVITALRACGPPTLDEIVHAAAVQASRILGSV